MFASRRRVYPAIMICAIGFGASAARADDASNQQLQQKVDQLETKVQALETQQNQSKSDQDAAALKKAAADTDSQSQMLVPMTGGSGYDPATGFHIASDDGNFFMHPWALAQFRGVINDRQSIHTFQGPLPGGGVVVPKTGSTESDGFEIHHLMLGIDGHVVSPNLEYYLMMDVPSAGGTETLQDAYATYRMGDGSPWKFKAGQFIDPVWHESNVDDGHQLLVDRSLAGALLGGNTGNNFDAERVQGVGIGYESEALRGEFDLTDGFRSANSAFFDTATGVAGIGAAGFPATNFGMSGRVEYKVMGDDTAWEGYKSLSAKDDKSDLLIFGSGIEWTEAKSFDNVFFTVDGQYTTAAGLSVYGALLENYGAWSESGSTRPINAVAGSYPNFGALLQAGFMLNPQWEPFVRYDLSIMNSRYADIMAFANPKPGGNAKATANSHEFTAGVNYYLFGQRAKVTGDLSFLPNGSPIDAPGLGILANQNHSEWVGRIQFQLSI